MSPFPTEGSEALQASGGTVYLLLQQIQSNITELRGQSQRTNDAIVELVKEVAPIAGLTSGQSQLAQSVRALEGTHQDLRRAIDKLTTDAEALGDRIAGLESDKNNNASDWRDLRLEVGKILAAGAFAAFSAWVAWSYKAQLDQRVIDAIRQEQQQSSPPPQAPGG